MKAVSAPSETHLLANALANRPQALHVLLVLLLERPAFDFLGNLVLEHRLEHRVLARRGVVGLNASRVVQVVKRVGRDLRSPVAVPRRENRVGLVLL